MVKRTHYNICKPSTLKPKILTDLKWRIREYFLNLRSNQDRPRMEEETAMEGRDNRNPSPQD